MRKPTQSTFEIVSWNEQPYDEAPNTRKLARARVVKRFAGDLVGEGTLDYLFLYREDGSATFVGLERVTGTLLGRSGTFVLQHLGSWADNVARSTYEIIAGSATGELAGLSGAGVSAVTHATPHPFALDVELA